MAIGQGRTALAVRRGAPNLGNGWRSTATPRRIHSCDEWDGTVDLHSVKKFYSRLLETTLHDIRSEARAEEGRVLYSVGAMAHASGDEAGSRAAGRRRRRRRAAGAEGLQAPEMGLEEEQRKVGVVAAVEREVDEPARRVRQIRPEAPPHDAVPRRPVRRVELLRSARERAGGN